jgi:hypothetical protein
VNYLQTIHALAEATPPPAPDGHPGVVNTPGIMSFVIGNIVPVLFAMLGVWIIMKARTGEAGRVLTSGFIAVIGTMFIVGSVAFMAAGDSIVKLLFGSG